MFEKGSFLQWFIRRVRSKSPILNRVILATVAGLFHNTLYSSQSGLKLENWIYDTWIETRGVLIAPPEVLVISIEDSSFSALNASTLANFPRRHLASAIKRLHQYHSRAVFLDLSFQSVSQDPYDDLELASALKEIPSIISIFETSVVSNDVYGNSHTSKTRIPPLPLLADSVYAVGSSLLPTDNGVIRRFPIIFDQANTTPSFLAILSKFYDPPLPLPGQRDRIKFYGPSRTLRSASIQDIIADTTLSYADVFKDRIVFIGAYQTIAKPTAAKDTFVVPFDRETMFGVEIHATTAANVIRGEWTKRIGYKVESLALNIIAFLIAYLVSRVSPLRAAKLFFGLFILWLFLSYRLFVNDFILPGAVLMIVVMPIVLLCHSLLKYLEVRRTLQRLQLIAKQQRS